MGKNYTLNLSKIPNDPKCATKMMTNLLFENVCPLMLSIRNKLQKYDGPIVEDDIKKLKDVFALCISQIKKSFQTLFDIFKAEYHQHVSLQESRQCTIERLSWCVNRLACIEQKIDDCNGNQDETIDDSILVTPVYFVNWIDHTFEVLSKLSGLIYKTDYKETDALNTQWKNDVVECVSSLHISLDELLLSAMTLRKYCLPSDQHIVKARCQVVLRETKALFFELIEGDLDDAFKVRPESLKLPIMPSNVNVLIDVLKDVLYALETNTNTALLTLVVHSFSYNVLPVDVLKKHFLNTNGTCSCSVESVDEVADDCSFVKDFDLYNERLLQIGSFAVSCSSDQSRILTLRSGLASLEALDPHLVPAVMLAADSLHAGLLVDSWRQEVQEIKDSIFLIVDPAAFAEKTKQMMHQMLLDYKEVSYDNGRVCDVINIGCVVQDFFSVYTRLEPDALTQYEKLVPLLADLNKVQMECKIVSNLLSSGEDFVYEAKASKNVKEVTVDQLMKRLKLLYTLVSRINSLLHPKENEEFFECEIEEEVPVKNTTHTIRKNIITYIQSPRKPANFSRSIFARTNNMRSSTNKYPLQKLTKHLRSKTRGELNFSLQLDEIFNLSEVKGNCTDNPFARKQLGSLREPSVLYNFSPKKRSSLRKAVLNRHCKMLLDTEVQSVETGDKSERSEKENLMDEATSLQITDILNQMSDMTQTFSKKRDLNATYAQPSRGDTNQPTTSNVLNININTNADTLSISKQVWKIPVNASAVEMPLDESSVTVASNITVPSNVTTLERISDIDLVESKLNSLKTLEFETSL